MGSVGRSRGPRGMPLGTAQRGMIFRSPAVASRVRWELNASALIAPLCPPHSHTNCLVERSQTRTTPSSLPVATSGETPLKATAVTQVGCGRTASSLPDMAFHSVNYTLVDVKQRAAYLYTQ